MAAMKPRTGGGPVEAVKENRSIILKLPVDGGGRIVLELSAQEAADLADVLNEVVAPAS